MAEHVHNFAVARVGQQDGSFVVAGTIEERIHGVQRGGINGPSAVRYPRGNGPGVSIVQQLDALPVGKAEVRRQGRAVAILAFGAPLSAALEVGEALNATVVNMRFVKPLDDALVIQLALSHDLLVTVEENTIQGGAGSAVAELLAREMLSVPLLQLGLPDRFVDQGEPARLLAECGLDAAGIRRSIEERKIFASGFRNSVSQA